MTKISKNFIGLWKVTLSLSLLISLSLTACAENFSTGFEDSQDYPIFEPNQCPFDPLDDPIQCGYLIVPENRDQPDGSLIELAAANPPAPTQSSTLKVSQAAAPYLTPTLGWKVPGAMSGISSYSTSVAWGFPGLV